MNATKRTFWAIMLALGNVAPLDAQPLHDDLFSFVRVKYSSGPFAHGFRMQYGLWGSWEVDFPTAEENFMRGLRTITQLPTSETSLAISITDPEFFEYPFAYMVEPGYLQLTQQEADSLREWCLRGGFLMIDDFHGEAEWRNFLLEFAKVFPDRRPQEIPATHPIFHCYHDFDKFPQVPGLGPVLYGVTYEKGGRIPRCAGFFDDQQRLMVLVNHNVDLGDSWEHATDRRYPSHYSRLGYMLGINYVIYAMTH